MARKRITMQQLADACGLSRNTVSKVFNDRGSVPEATRQTVLQKARELGYYQPPRSRPSSRTSPCSPATPPRRRTSAPSSSPPSSTGSAGRGIC